jgi:hypothetical protein
LKKLIAIVSLLQTSGKFINDYFDPCKDPRHPFYNFWDEVVSNLLFSQDIIIQKLSRLSQSIEHVGRYVILRPLLKFQLGVLS